MKGLEVSARFFREWGLPYIKREFPQLSGRLAAGLIGGSQAIGADDKLSRDHDGPMAVLIVELQLRWGSPARGARGREDVHLPCIYLGLPPSVAPSSSAATAALPAAVSASAAPSAASPSSSFPSGAAPGCALGGSTAVLFTHVDSS